MASEPIRLTQFSHGAGCGCKLGANDLVEVLKRFEPMGHPDLLVGLANGDDAAVWRRPNGRALIATLDFFTPVVDDARTWGRIAATNAVSDVYAMGGMPLFALNVVAWPKKDLPMELLGDVLEGAAEVARIGGWPVVGGHSIDGAEPLFGQVFVGEVEESQILSNVGARVGDTLVLTKPLGTGVITTAVKRLGPGSTESGGGLFEGYRAAVESPLPPAPSAPAVPPMSPGLGWPVTSTNC
jgi:selenide, water dikinase